MGCWSGEIETKTKAPDYSNIRRKSAVDFPIINNNVFLFLHFKFCHEIYGVCILKNKNKNKK